MRNVLHCSDAMQKENWLLATCHHIKSKSGSAPHRSPLRSNSAFFVPAKAGRKPQRRDCGSELTRTMLHCGGHWTLVTFLAVADFCALQTVSRVWRRSMMTEDAWKSLCHSLGASAMLYEPVDYAPGWKELFWRHLWSARSKWKMLGDEARAESSTTDFKIVVHCRFRPATEAAPAPRIDRSRERGAVSPIILGQKGGAKRETWRSAARGVAAAPRGRRVVIDFYIVGTLFDLSTKK